MTMREPTESVVSESECQKYGRNRLLVVVAGPQWDEGLHRPEKLTKQHEVDPRQQFFPIAHFQSLTCHCSHSYSTYSFLFSPRTSLVTPAPSCDYTSMGSRILSVKGTIVFETVMKLLPELVPQAISHVSIWPHRIGLDSSDLRNNDCTSRCRLASMVRRR